MKLKILSVGILACLLASLLNAQSFTYQGYLRDGGLPANGNFNMTFRLFAVASGGSSLATIGPVSVTVANGLFTRELNFGAVWTGAARFLEIEVGGVTLTPRVRINMTPYANTSTLLNIFESGTINPDRMVMTHSPAFQDWGLMYRDTDDSFHFVGAGISWLRVGLTEGYVGVGTTAPASRLDVLGGFWDTSSTEGDFRIGDAAHRLKMGISTGGGGAGHATIAAQGGINTLSLGAGTTLTNQRVLTIANGNVGVGTITPDRLFRVFGDRNAPLMELTNTNTGSAADGIAIGVSGSSGWAINALSNGANGIAVRGTASGAAAWAAYFLGRGHFSNNVAIGSDSITNSRLNVVMNSSTTNATLRLHETEAEFARLEFTNTNTARKWHIAGLIGSAVANDRLNFWNSAVGDILSIRGDGTVAVKVLEITGADLAEKFPTTEVVEPGMVVEIDPDNPGNLRKAQGAFSKRVVGIVAGANGLSKGIVLGNLENSEDHTPIAMSGRVWVYADATERGIEPGDFLTTSNKAGYAMAVEDLPRAQGAIIGKAMTRLEKGTTGMVLVVVNLQ